MIAKPLRPERTKNMVDDDDDLYRLHKIGENGCTFGVEMLLQMDMFLSV